MDFNLRRNRRMSECVTIHQKETNSTPVETSFKNNDEFKIDRTCMRIAFAQSH